MDHISRNASIYTERATHIRTYLTMIREVGVKDQHLFNLHLSELPAYEGRS